MFLIANPTFELSNFATSYITRKLLVFLSNLRFVLVLVLVRKEIACPCSFLISNKTQTSLGVDHVSVIDNIIHIPFSEEKKRFLT